jgi:phosphoribosylamine--glycine ligase
VCVVLASGGYPGSYQKGHEIVGLSEAEAMEDVEVFQAGTAERNGKLVTAGGRVLGVTALGASLADAQARAYRAVDCISWPDCTCRRDIADKAIAAAPRD